MNENYAQPSVPGGDLETLRQGILKGIYPLVTQEEPRTDANVQLLGSGAILGEVLAAQKMLRDDWQIEAAVWSVTSFSELQRDGMSSERNARLGEVTDAPYVTTVLNASTGPIIAATDYVRAVPELIRAYVPRKYVTLGTDGFGRSDTRQALREFFEVDRKSIVIAALKALNDEGVLGSDVVDKARQLYRRPKAMGAASWLE
jgi:pyruvate dehydrogenase E1 component